MRLLARASAGLLVWAFGFSLLYGLHGLGCALGWQDVGGAGVSLFRLVLVGTWLTFCAGGLAVVLVAARMPAGLQRRLGLASALAGCGATLVTGLPTVIASECL
ncbi:hypothetical protein [Roseomonas sp. USHLN139]|uniref:hypothetical protein n=1 Tax=Roseomonas sp. USHLN139 TaxID=3081298 RepID=UPI003B01A274